MPPVARLLLGSLIGAAASGEAAEPVELIRSNGPDENRINIAVLGDGYTREELTDYASDVDRLLAEFFDNQPFTDYAAYFNVRRVDVTSNESGVDHPARDEYRDTALGAYYDCAGIERLVCIDHAAVLDVLDRSLAVDVRDIVMVLVNDDEYGGSGGAFAVASTNQHSTGIMLHELGHSFGLLADEYGGGGLECDDSVEPPEVNVTRESTGAKWVALDRARNAGPRDGRKTRRRERLRRGQVLRYRALPADVLLEDARGGVAVRAGEH